MNQTNKTSLAAAIVGGDATLAAAYKTRLIAQLVNAPEGALCVMSWAPVGARGVEVFFHIHGDYRRGAVICDAKKWRSQWRRLGAQFVGR